MVALNEDLNLAILKGLLFGWVVLCQHLRWGILLKKIFLVCDIITWLSLITLKKKLDLNILLSAICSTDIHS